MRAWSSFTRDLRFRHRLRRMWRQGVADRRTRTLDALAGVLGSDPVLAVIAGSNDLGAVTEIVFSSGVEVRLASCYRPVVSVLAERATKGVVVLERAADHGACWGLYFAAGGEWLPLLAPEITVQTGPGGFGDKRAFGGPVVPQAAPLPV